MKQLDFAFVTVCEDAPRFVWETNVLLESIKLQNKEWLKYTYVCIFKQKGEFVGKWRVLHDLYPEVNYRFYEDDKNYIWPYLAIYRPILRPFCLVFLFKEISPKATIYVDTDIIFINKFPLESFLNDDINYMSDTVSVNDYMSHEYFESKINSVREELKEEYLKFDALDQLCKVVHIDRDVIVRNKNKTGGVQYILKDITADYWKSVLEDSLMIRSVLMTLNQKFMKGMSPQERENNGFQSWCADLWACLWNLWKRGKDTQTPSSMDFAWATDYIEKLEKVYFLHNAGVVEEDKMIIRDGKKTIDAPAFYKGRFVKHSPFTDIEYLNKIIEHPISKNYCTAYYTQFIKDLGKKYQLHY